MTDAFLDPVSGTRVLAIGVVNQMYSLFQSTDAGATFGPALYQAAAGQTMTSVEIARSDPNVVYLALRASTRRAAARAIDRRRRALHDQDLSATWARG